MKKRILFGVILVLFIGILCGCNKDAKEFKKSYEALNGQTNAKGKVHRTITIDEDNPFVTVADSDIVTMINDKETFYVYFGDPLCPWCRSVLEKAIEVAKKNNIEKIYYVKIWDDEGNEVVRDKLSLNEDGTIKTEVEGTLAYKSLLGSFDIVLSDYNLTSEDGGSIPTGEKRIYAPNFFYVKDGVVVKMVEGISDKQTDSRGELTEEILNDEETLFEDFFQNN